ncbi:efflux RND transporter periplasmic adaptor subunit [Methylotuvimicrobium sp. KM2]|uniref:efflux RND transporter periplasmic adaptor subunit n=1 Tax=Methylotuvimicrobium sp. KM2 TaxID=3133976 RepID=UPI0031013BEE
MNEQKYLMKALLPIAVLLGAVGAAWAMIELRPGMLPQAEQSTLPMVEIVRVKPQTVRLNVMSQGVVTPREEIDLIAEVSGKIVELNPALLSGGYFEAGDLLVMIDPRDYDFAIVAAQANIAEAKRVLINEKALAEQAHSEWLALGQGEASDLALRKPQLAEAEAKLSAAEAELAKAKLNRGRCELRAPFSGRVLSKQAGRGQYLSTGSAVARIYANDVAEIRLPIGIDQLAFLDLPYGNRTVRTRWPKVTLRSEVGGQLQQWQGRIVRSEAALDGSSGQLFLVAQVDRPEWEGPGRAPLLSGLFVQAEIEGVTREKVFTLPPAALNSLQQVKVVDGERRLEFRKIEVLRHETDRVIVRAGLRAGESVVISEMPMPVAGMQVAITNTQSVENP